jgi:3-keto-5-aminohexanoate cleavage enzyme
MNCVINFTPTGMIPTKEMTPHVPITVEEIVEQVLAAAEIGITSVHLHARDPKTGLPTYKADVYGEMIAGIRKYRPDLVLCVSTSGRNFNELDKRAEVLGLKGELKPDMASLTLSSVNFNKQASVNSPDMIFTLAQKMKKNGILPELEVFDVGMINYAKYLERKGFLEPPYYFVLILGNIACAQADLLHCGVMLRDLPDDSIWSIGGVGDVQLMLNSLAVSIGGGVRVGLEDNIYFDPQRKKLAGNVDLVKRIHKLAEANERLIMKPAELRELLHLESGFGSYGRTSKDTDISKITI